MASPTAAPHRDRTALDAADVAAALIDRARSLSTVLTLVATNSHKVTRAAAIISTPLPPAISSWSAGMVAARPRPNILPASWSGASVGNASRGRCWL